MNWLTVCNRTVAVELDAIPLLKYDEFARDMKTFFNDPACHCAAYFADEIATGEGDLVTMYCIMLNDSESKVYIACHRCRKGAYLTSLTDEITAMHLFEREIWERYDIEFIGHPWLKPLRYPTDRADKMNNVHNYPFYDISGETLHEVNVGPIHAGIIEPGVFRFICNGEIVLHLETAFGYQHRGVENEMCKAHNMLRQMIVAESIAGDSSVSHGMAACTVLEKLTGTEVSMELDLERAVALEMERVATHIADVAALSMDMGYQLGRVTCEALRTMTVNTTQYWCGNRFGKGIMRPGGSNYPLNEALCDYITGNIKEIGRRMVDVGESIISESSMLGRMEDMGVVTPEQVAKVGGVGLAARASGISRDIRKSHPYAVFGREIIHAPIIVHDGDVMSRMKLRLAEIRQSVSYISEMLNIRKNRGFSDDANSVDNAGNVVGKPFVDGELRKNSLVFAMVEGWRGEICHVALTDQNGDLKRYKIKDPSFHNWMLLTLAIRGIEISEFPVYNKSFNLSYCGLDL